MKHRTLTHTLLAFALMLGLLSGCTGGTGGKAEDVHVDLNEFYSEIIENHEMQIGMEELSAETLDNFYPGLAEMEAEQRHVYMAMITMVTQEFALVEVKNSDDADKVKEIFQTRIDTQADGGAWYPDAMASWKNNSRIVTHGNYVLMVVHPDADEIVEAFESKFA